MLLLLPLSLQWPCPHPQFSLRACISWMRHSYSPTTPPPRAVPSGRDSPTSSGWPKACARGFAPSPGRSSGRTRTDAGQRRRITMYALLPLPTPPTLPILPPPLPLPSCARTRTCTRTHTRTRTNTEHTHTHTHTHAHTHTTSHTEHTHTHTHIVARRCHTTLYPPRACPPTPVRARSRTRLPSCPRARALWCDGPPPPPPLPDTPALLRHTHTLAWAHACIVPSSPHPPPVTHARTPLPRAFPRAQASGGFRVRVCYAHACCAFPLPPPPRGSAGVWEAHADGRPACAGPEHHLAGWPAVGQFLRLLACPAAGVCVCGGGRCFVWMWV